MVVAFRRNVAPFTWDDVRSQNLSKSAARIIDEGREFDAYNGIIVPMVPPPDRRRCLVLAEENRTSRLAPSWRSNDRHLQPSCALSELRRFPQEASRSRHLTPREREVIRWVAAGKSDDEISMILNIGRETVASHVENSKRKLDATRRTYAVVQALRFGEITL